MLQKFKNYTYLYINGIRNIEDLIGKKIWFVFPSQGIVSRKIKSVSYHENSRKWLFDAYTQEAIEEIGVSCFFHQKEAKEHQLKKMDSYSKEQQEKILWKSLEEKERDIKELNTLLEKYPDEESRKLPERNCKTCRQSELEYPEPHTCDMCTSLDAAGEYEMWKPAKKLFEK